MEVESNKTDKKEIKIIIITQVVAGIILFFLGEIYHKIKIQKIYYLFLFIIILLIYFIWKIIYSLIIDDYLKIKNSKIPALPPLPLHSTTKLIEEPTFSIKNNNRNINPILIKDLKSSKVDIKITQDNKGSYSGEAAIKEMLEDMKRENRVESDFIQKQVDEVNKFFLDFSFTTTYQESSNSTVDPQKPLHIENKGGDAIRMFFICVANILSNCIEKGNGRPLDNDCFKRIFPSGNIKIINDVKNILSKFSKTIDLIRNSNSYKENNKIIIHVTNNFIDDIREYVLNHKTILLKIIDDLFPINIQICNNKKVAPINNLTAFFDGLIDIKNKLSELEFQICLVDLDPRP